MKIGVLSDTHLNHVTNDLKEIYDRYLSDTDLILHAGDIVSIEVVNFLSGKNFHGVHGNMDPSDVQNVLPAKKVIEVGSYRLGLIHGWGFSAGLEERIRSEFNEVDAIIYGHSHHAVSHEREGVLFFNPGTATGFSSEGLHSVGILQLGSSIQGDIIEV